MLHHLTNTISEYVRKLERSKVVGDANINKIKDLEADNERCVRYSGLHICQTIRPWDFTHSRLKSREKALLEVIANLQKN